MTAIAYKITVGSTDITADSAAALLNLETQAALSVPVNMCRITLANPPQLKTGEVIKVSLGSEGTPHPIFTGKIAHLSWTFTGASIEAVSCLRQLTGARFNLLFEKSTAGAIAKDLAKRSQVKVAQAENGIKFPVYAIGDQHTAYDHLRRLGTQCGFDVFANSDDQLTFQAYAPKTTHTLTYGVEILAYDRTAHSSPISGVEIYGESPASQGQGDKAYSWLTKKEVKGSSGGKSGTVLRLADPTARTQAIAGKIAANTLTARQAQIEGWVRVLGAPPVELGDRLALKAMPIPAHSGQYKVTGVSYHLSPTHGLTTTIHWQEEP